LYELDPVILLQETRTYRPIRFCEIMLQHTEDFTWGIFEEKVVKLAFYLANHELFIDF
jgi:hypothetical protein